MKIFPGMFIFCVILSMYACKEEPVLMEQSVEGTWIIQNAMRNGKLTGTLKDGFFSFDSTGNMQTNILGDTLVSAFERMDDIISQKENFPLTYVIEYLDEDSMHLSAEIRKFQFDFYTSKYKDEEQVVN